MTFKHKLSRRLALLKDAWLVVALAALGCEKPLAVTDPGATIRLQITPKSVTMPTDGAAQLMAVALTPAGDTATIDVNWSVTGGTIADTNTHGGRHYAGYKATQNGKFKVVAHGHGSSGSGSDTATITVVPAAVASVKVIPAVVSLLVGASVQLTATTADSAGNVLSGRSISWSSSNASVASVNSNGLVASVAPGSATITATSEGQSAAVPVTVTNVPVASLQVSPASANLLVGQALSLTATTRDSAGNPLIGRPVSWTSSNPSVATVSSSGQVTGVTQGSATITATSESKSNTAALTVTSVPVAAVAVAPATANLTVGQTVQLTATPKDSAGSALTGRTVTWASSNTAVATVGPSGLVTSKAAGSATITATSEGKAGSATVTVAAVPVASVAVTPATATIPSQGTLQLTATPKDANGNTLTGRSVTWTSSAPTQMSVSPSGLVTDLADNVTVSITATVEGQSGASVVTVQAPVASGSVPDPTLLPVASGQAPNLSAYLALNVANQPAGFSYNDPVTRVKVWKVTSSSTPSANSGAGHDYSDGPNEVSLGWGTNNNTHTILIRGDGMAYYLVDFTRGAGFSNYRRLTVQPARDLCFTFSNLASQPRIAYILTGSQVVRFNTATMQTENTGNFPLNQAGFGWLQHDKTDGWFAGLTTDQTVAFAWNSQTNELRTHGESWLNEGRLERDGRYIALTNGNSTFRLWDLATNTFGPTQSDRINFWLGHNANLRSQWVTTDVNANAPFDLDRYDPSGGQIVKTRFLTNSAGAGVHHSGNWVQSDAELGGNLNRQWSFMSGIDAMWPGVAWMQAIGVVRSDGSDARLLLHHYSINPVYFADPFAQASPDGRVVIFNSDMNGSGRYDLFVVEMPLR